MKKKTFVAMGLMSGTSMDGIDISLIKSDGKSDFISILDDFHKFSPGIQTKLINLRNRISTIKDLEEHKSEINELDKEFTLFNSKIIKRIIQNYDNEIDLVGFHGQTIFHNSNLKITKQLGDGKLLSQDTQKIVINNFREEDIVNGGQGAPLTPIFHQLMCGVLKNVNKFNLPINIINIGGITNVTQVNDILNYSRLNAFDIGPGNCLIDEWIRKNSTKEIDFNGEIAKSGKANELILNQAIENFIQKDYQKSLDIKDFDIAFCKGLSLEDGCATITKFTAHLIAEGIKYVNDFNNLHPSINLVCGGGRKNNFLLEVIKNNLNEKKINLETIDKYGFNGDFVESQAFGYLAIRAFLKLPISFPTTTRCYSPTIGGTINKNF